MKLMLCIGLTDGIRERMYDGKGLTTDILVS